MPTKSEKLYLIIQRNMHTRRFTRDLKRRHIEGTGGSGAALQDDSFHHQSQQPFLEEIGRNEE
jgi:hypothetical protein